MSDDKITIDNHPSYLTVSVPKTVDGVKTLVDMDVWLERVYLHAFNVCTDTSLATLRLRAETIGLAPHGDKAQIVARAHEYLSAAASALATVADWKETGMAPSVEAGKRGRPAGSTNKAPEPTYTIFDGARPHTVNATAFKVYCDACTAGMSLAKAAEAALAD